MKPLFFSLLVFLPLLALSQKDSTLVQARLFLPAHVTKGLMPGQPLRIHFITEDASGIMQTAVLRAHHVKDNQYRFVMKPCMYFRLVFVTGEYSAQLFCIDNRKGKVMEDYDFNILLEKKRFDPSDLKFIAPCMQKEE